MASSLVRLLALSAAASLAVSADGALLQSHDALSYRSDALPAVVDPLCRLRGGADGSSNLKTWWYKTLAKFGIFLKKGRLLVLGLDNAGKTTLLHMLKDERLSQHNPTQHPSKRKVLHISRASSA